MRHKPNFRLLTVFQAFLFTGYGFILKNLDDDYADKFLFVGIAVLTFFGGQAFFRYISRNFQKKESL